MKNVTPSKKEVPASSMNNNFSPIGEMPNKGPQAFTQEKADLERKQAEKKAADAAMMAEMKRKQEEAQQNAARLEQERIA